MGAKDQERTSIVGTIEIIVTSGFDDETATWLSGRLDRIQASLLQRGCIRTTVTVRTKKPGKVRFTAKGRC